MPLVPTGLAIPILSPEEDEARFITRLATDLIVAQITASHQAKIDGPRAVRMAHMLLRDARRQVAAPADDEAV